MFQVLNCESVKPSNEFKDIMICSYKCCLCKNKISHSICDNEKNEFIHRSHICSRKKGNKFIDIPFDYYIKNPFN